MFSKKEKINIKVDGMKCSHCTEKVLSALKDIDGVKKVRANLAKKELTIISDRKIEEKIIKETIENLDYTYLGIVNK